uniref:Secreted protein n=1 Tax=Anguilla anguilla TaxID=7936 RepID=A0A0E9VN04_ANGAN
MQAPMSTIWGTALRPCSISLTLGSLLTSSTVGPMKRGSMLLYWESSRKARITWFGKNRTAMPCFRSRCLSCSISSAFVALL